MTKVFIGVGHGGKDSGAVGNGGLLEKNLNLSIAQACGAELERHGVTIRFSRTRDEDDPVDQEVAECNSFAPDLAVDIHHNAGGGRGTEVFYSIAGGTGKKLAENILAEIVKLGHKSRGVKTRTNSGGSDYYGFIRLTKAHAVIVEVCFLDSEDVALIDTEAERVKVGKAVAHGILKTLGVTPKNEPTAASVLYRVQAGAYSSKARAEAQKKRLQAAGFDAVIITT